MEVKNPTVKEILRKYRRIEAISHAENLLYWDMDTYMPKNGAEYRGDALAELDALSQELVLDPGFVNLVRRAEGEDLNDYEKGIVRVLKRDIEYYEKLPPDFLAEMARAATLGFQAWREAKEKADFKIFQPHLERWVEIQRKLAEYLGYEEHPYDALLDRYHEGLRYKNVKDVFSELVPFASKFLRKVLDSGAYVPRHGLEDAEYCREDMESLNRKVLTVFGADWESFRMDVSTHPFTDGVGKGDVRITTWYHGRDFRRSLLATVHEWGHAVYESVMLDEFAYTPLHTGVSFVLHESQSRFWENHIGRSRAFVESFYEEFRRAVPALFNYTPDDVYLYFNLVRPELLRVEADEVTYILHIALRYELEVAMLDGELPVSELPQAWNEKMEDYLGVVPPDDARGVLQDVHWSSHSFGYFPTYALGTVLSAQIRSAMERDLGPLEELVRERSYGPVRKWLAEKVHRFGSTFQPDVIIRRVTGENLSPEHFISYAEERYGKIYGLK
ncbi:MAG TPA: carboxypeptidase M32 [Euryarchaeota archaeon]|nr:carboxypeptidase M32 [Euryarchaeota archaeon]